MDAGDWTGAVLGTFGAVVSVFTLHLQFGPRRHADLVVSIEEGGQWPRLMLRNVGQHPARTVQIEVFHAGENLAGRLAGTQPIPVIAPGHASGLTFNVRGGRHRLYSVRMSWADGRPGRQRREHSLTTY